MGRHAKVAPVLAAAMVLAGCGSSSGHASGAGAGDGSGGAGNAGGDGGQIAPGTGGAGQGGGSASGGDAATSTTGATGGGTQTGGGGATGTGGGSSGLVAWVYHAGAMSPDWPFDYSWGNLVVDYQDTSGHPRSAPADIKATGPVWSGWQPASKNWSFDVTGLNYLSFALEPTVAHQDWHSEFHYVNDVPTNVTVDVNSGMYGPADPPIGQWSFYKIPLKDFFPNGDVPANVYKFFIQNNTETNGESNTWYIDDVAFTAD
jgi:hypothetical protein